MKRFLAGQITYVSFCSITTQFIFCRLTDLMVDKIIEIVADKHIIALKNVSFAEPHFSGHFPQQPVMPGVLMLEALAQASGVLMFVSSGLTEAPSGYTMLTGVDSCRFRRVVLPGDQLMLHIQLQRKRHKLTRFAARAEVNGEIACEAILTSFHSDIK